MRCKRSKFQEISEYSKNAKLPESPLKVARCSNRSSSMQIIENIFIAAGKCRLHACIDIVVKGAWRSRRSHAGSFISDRPVPIAITFSSPGCATLQTEGNLTGSMCSFNVSGDGISIKPMGSVENIQFHDKIVNFNEI